MTQKGLELLFSQALQASHGRKSDTRCQALEKRLLSIHPPPNMEMELSY